MSAQRDLNSISSKISASASSGATAMASADKSSMMASQVNSLKVEVLSSFQPSWMFKWLSYAPPEAAKTGSIRYSQL